MSILAEIEITGEPTALYKLYGADGNLLYVGITRDITARLSKHAARSWWPQVVRKTMTWYGTRPEAKVAESLLIATEQPPHNKEQPASVCRYVVMAEDLAKRIYAGEFASDSPLPTEFELMTACKASRETVRRALEVLRERNLIQTVRGRGSFILPEDERTPSQE